MDLSKVLFLDIETTRDGGTIRLLGLLRPGRDGLSLVPDRRSPRNIDRYAKGCRFLCGHNVLRHDAPKLAERWPALRVLRLPRIDTLELSPLAFPRHPYHHLVKGYKLARAGVNDPVKDCELTETLLRDEVEAFRGDARPLARLYRRFFPEADAVFEWAGVGPEATAEELEPIVRAAGLGDRLCRTALSRYGDRLRAGDTALAKPFGYALAWITVAEGDSILPPWVHHEYPAAGEIITALRGVDCGRCDYCRSAHDRDANLRRFFAFDSLRPAQAPIVDSLLEGRNPIALLPTSGGKSLCFQLPAIIRAHREKRLTVVISPLQALMKDQVDVLRDRFHYPHAAALYGSLTALERRDVREGVLSGRIDILYVAPEQLRNRSFLGLIRQRQWATWVVDEAHCLSKWGHDFRPDYLYIPRLLREQCLAVGRDLPQLAFFTATAKKEVVEEIMGLFARGLGVGLTLHDGGTARPNLSFDVVYVEEEEKAGRLFDLVSGAGGASIVYCSTRRRTERFAAMLAAQGVRADHYHAGRLKDKREIQGAFVRGELDCVVATNAFGMGVDKSDVRLVVHVDMPGSLESYLQEAGRAGRDGAPARGVLLFNLADIDEQFRRDRDGRLSEQDVRSVYRAVRTRSRRTGRGEVVMTPAEILRAPEADSDLDLGTRDFGTKVRVAVSVLEDAGLLARHENRVRAWNVAFRFATLEEAKQRLQALDVQEPDRVKWLGLLEHLLEASGRGYTAFDSDLVSDATGIPARALPGIFRQLTEVGLLDADTGMSAVFAQNVAGHARLRFERLKERSRAVLDVMREECPDAEPEQPYSLSLRRICSAARERVSDPKALESPEDVMDAVEDAQRAGLLRFRKIGKNELQVSLTRRLDEWGEELSRRDAVAAAILDLLHAKADPAARRKDVRVEFRYRELPGTDHAENEAALLFLHRNRVIYLENGLALFRSAMRLVLDPKKNLRDFDMGPLAEHYRQKTAQVHVMAEYARRLRETGRPQDDYVRDYFRMTTSDFLAKYFSRREEEIERAVSPELYRKIVTDLANPAQEQIVRTRQKACLVLAGPGSGKTRAILHRVAYLVHVRRVPPERILVVAYNRQAVLQVRRGLKPLLGSQAGFVDVYTFHGLAMFLTGTSFDRSAARSGADPFEGLIRDAVRLLADREAGSEEEEEEDERRRRLLRGYEYILVDEYQDIDGDQYELVSQIADRARRRTGRSAVQLLAVGDDDQNIYTFRQTDVGFIRRFSTDYESEPIYLVENYRSTKNIIAATNHVIARNADRMKGGDHQVRIDRGREMEPAGGPYERIDPLDGGRVVVLAADSSDDAARGVAAEIERLVGLPGGPRHGRIAVLGRTRNDLRPVRSLLTRAGIPNRTFDVPGYPLVAVREVLDLLEHVRGLEGTLRSGSDLHAEIVKHLRSHPIPGRVGEQMNTLLEGYLEEHGSVAVTPASFSEYVWDASRSGSETLAREDRVVLATMHASKGLEFDTVFLLSTGYRAPVEETEEERRLSYVAGTRARHGLYVLDTAGQVSPFARDLEGIEEHRLHRRRIAIPGHLRDLPVDGEEDERVLSLADVWLSYGARPERASVCQDRLARLPAGAPLSVERRVYDNRVRHYLVHEGHRVARLSVQASSEIEADARWSVVGARVHAIVRCRRGEVDDEVELPTYWTVVPELTLRRRS